MKRHERALALLLACCVFVVSCTSSGSDASPDETSTPSAATPELSTPNPTSAVDETPDIPAVSDDELIAAALAEYEADPQPAGTIAWDVLDTRVSEDRVSFVMCTWDGLTADDAIRDVVALTTVDTNGSISARITQSSPTSGDCLNTQLINSAIATINAHDEYWAEVDLRPETFSTSPLSQRLFTDNAYLNLTELTDGWLADDVYYVIGHLGNITDSLEAPLAYRRYIDEQGQPVLDIATCRPMNPAYGLYRGEVLLDDFRSDNQPAPHSVDQYHLTPDLDTDLGWRIDFTDGRAWTDCFFTDDWSDFLNIWRPEPMAWELHDQ